MEDLRGLDGRGDRVPFARFLVGLCIPDVGTVTGRLLPQRFDSLDDLCAATEEDLVEIDGIGEEVAHRITSWFPRAENQAFLARLLEGGAGIRPDPCSRSRRAPWPTGGAAQARTGQRVRPGWWTR